MIFSRFTVLALLTAAFYALSFPGYDVWPLSFIAFVPLLWILEDTATQFKNAAGWPEKKKILQRGFIWAWLAGFATHFGGHYWLVGMLERFSSFPLLLCVLLTTLLMAWQGLALACFALLWLALRTARWPLVWLTPVAWIVVEKLFPVLFDNYFSNTWHNLPLLVQTADLGGPLLLSFLALTINALAYEVLRRLIARRKLAYLHLGAIAAIIGLSLAYGSYRTTRVKQQLASAPKQRVGLVQTNMGIFQKHENPVEGIRRHILQSEQLVREEAIDLLIWPESALPFFLSADVKSVKNSVLGTLEVPLLFGGLYLEKTATGVRHYNTAFITDEKGNIKGHYHKTYLLAFGEYLPFGEWLPWLYTLSPRSGHFTRGTSFASLPHGQYRVSALICYEDILPNFVRKAVAQGKPHVLVNMTNDAWFGDTIEPWTHLALSKFRAVEHHRYLVRATNSGVSAVIDPLGRVVKYSEVFARDQFGSEIAMLSGTTLYALLGDWIAWLCLGLVALFFARQVTVKRARVDG